MTRMNAICRHVLSMLCTLCLLGTLAAQDAYHLWLQDTLQSGYDLPQGQWKLPDTEGATLASSWLYGATGTTILTDTLPFAQKLRIDVPVASATPWDAGFGMHTTDEVAAGEAVLLAMWLRAVDSTAKVSIFVEHATTYDKEVYWTAELDTSWRLYLLPFEADQYYPVGGLSVGLHLAWRVQRLELGGVAMLGYGQAVSADELPEMNWSELYGGWEPDAPWRAEATVRIDSLRKAEVVVRVEDGAGMPLAGAAVHLRMLRHHYGFGSAVVASMIAGNPAWNPVYEERILHLAGAGRGFNEVVFENALKWPAWENNWIATKDQTAQAAQWLAQHGIRLRGHNILWPGWQYLPGDIEAHQDDPAYIEARIMAHIEHITNYPGIEGNVFEWDVLNEITTNRDLEFAFAGTPGYDTGRELYRKVFEKVKQEAPEARLYINDYVTISLNNKEGLLYDRYKQFIGELVDAGAPLEAIGFQAHIGQQLPSLYDVQAILDDFHQSFGLPAKITEFDLHEDIPPQVAANYMRDFMTLVFSHPSTEGFLMWGFWDGAHWQANAPLFDEDWTLKPTGAAFIDLVFDQWWTDTLAYTDADGQVRVRGFKGQYALSVDCGDVVFTDTFELVEPLEISVTACQSATAADEQMPAQPRVFPNPAAPGQTLLVSGLSANATLKLISPDGRMQGSLPCTDGAVTLPSDLAPGLWLLAVQQGRQRWYLRLMVN